MVLFNAGDQLPDIPLIDVVGNGVIVCPAQYDPTGEKLGVMNGITVMVMDVVLAHCPTAGVKV
jgi:hypothetical protein